MAASVFVSVVIPCHNGEKTLERAVASVFAQGIPGTEVVIVDDLSRDGSADLALALARRWPGIVVARQPENRGAAATRNMGLKMASAPVVCFLDCDDEQAPGFLADTLAVLDRSPHLASVSTGIVLADFDGTLDPLLLATMANSLPGSVVVRRPVAELIGGFPENRAFRGRAAGEDAAFRLILGQCFPQAHLDQPLYRYYVAGSAHFEFLVRRTRVEGGRPVFSELTPEEADGSIDAAGKAYLDAFAARVRAAANSTLAVGSLPFRHLLSIGAAEVAVFTEAASSIPDPRGGVAPAAPPGAIEGYVLHFAAAHAPGEGDVAWTGNGREGGLCWLASGARRTNRRPIRIVAADGDRARAIAEQCGLGDWIAVHAAPSAPDSLRLLCIEGGALPATARALAESVAPGGLLIVRHSDPATIVWLGEQPATWLPLAALGQLALFERSTI